MKMPIFFAVIAFFAASALQAQDQFPVPCGNANQLFYLQRNANTNTIVYELNYKNNTLDSDEPVHVYWLRYTKQGEKVELNFLQRKFAYGIQSTCIAKDKYQLRLVSYKNFPMVLEKDASDKYYVYATINQKQAILNRIFVKITGGTLWTPNVEYVEVKGIDPATGKEVMQRLKI